ncbi:MAG: ATP-binding protein [Actinomycetota bacterium]
MEFLSVPFHFISTFALSIAAAGGVWMAVTHPSLVPRGLLRIFFAVGWGLLGLAEAAHGSLLIGSEIDQATLALRAGAYALLVGSLFSPRRTGPEAVAFAPAAAMPTFLAAAGAWLAMRSRLEERSRLAVAFLLLAGSEVALGQGVAEETARRDTLWYLGHALRLTAAAAIGAWMWQGFRRSVRVRFVAAFVVLLFLVVAIVAGAMTQVFAGNVRSQALDEAAREGEAQKQIIREQSRDAVQDAKQVASADDIRVAASVRDPILGDLARRLESPGGVFEASDFLAFLAPDGVILAYSSTGSEGEPPPIDDIDATSLAGTEIAVSALSGTQAGSIDALGANKLAIVGAFPINNPPGVDPPGQPIGIAGAVAVGQVIDESYLVTQSERAGVEFSVAVPQGVLATTLPTGQGLLGGDLSAVFEGGGTLARETTVAFDDFFSAFVPLEREDGQVIGALVVSEPSEVLEVTQRNVGQLLFLLVLAAAAVAVVLAYVTASRITSPILRLTDAAQRVREGDLTGRVNVEAADEIGTLGGAFNEMTESIGKLTGDLRRAADEEFELRSRLQTILQSMSDGVIAVDSEAKIVAFNREAERIFGTNAESALGQSARQVVRLLDAAGSTPEVPLFSLQRGSVSELYAVGGGNGARIPVAMTSAPITDDDGEVVGAVALVRDMTPELEVERMKTEFLSNISHELRTPLTPIKGYTELLRRKSVPRKQQVAFLESIQSSVGRLERIVEMLIDVSSMEAGRLAPKTAPVDLDSTTADLVERWKSSFPKHRFQRTGFRGLPPVNADERLLPRAIDELIDNAVKFTPKGGKVGVTAEVESSRNGALARISVTDQGPGMTKEQIEQIFQEFYQADASATREFGGLGLGLGFVRRIVEAHGGKLEAESRPGKGSRFSILVPVSPDGPRSTSRKSRPKSIKKGRR